MTLFPKTKEDKVPMEDLIIKRMNGINHELERNYTPTEYRGKLENRLERLERLYEDLFEVI